MLSAGTPTSLPCPADAKRGGQLRSLTKENNDTETDLVFAQSGEFGVWRLFRWVSFAKGRGRGKWGTHIPHHPPCSQTTSSQTSSPRPAPPSACSSPRSVVPPTRAHQLSSFELGFRRRERVGGSQAHLKRTLRNTRRLKIPPPYPVRDVLPHPPTLVLPLLLDRLDLDLGALDGGVEEGLAGEGEVCRGRFREGGDA